MSHFNSDESQMEQPVATSAHQVVKSRKPFLLMGLMLAVVIVGGAFALVSQFAQPGQTHAAGLQNKARFTVSPSGYVNNFTHCGLDSHGGVQYATNCPFTLKNTSKSQTLHWTGSTSDTTYYLSPASGSIAPGKSVTVQLLTTNGGVTCSSAATVTFKGLANTISVPVICAQVFATPNAYSFSNTSCTHKGNWTCVVTVTAHTINGVHLNEHWVASSDIAGVRFSPSNGTLALGKSQKVTVTIPGKSCPTSGSIHFVVPGALINAGGNFLSFSC
ncbi:MAG TPA: hypothetical protein VL485_21350 [Ktedonobacteraceae bacterium]|jgi:hypothetical protein|nr:hypothetical protein [Ktedonobacteraceae bacterium]